MGTAAVSQKGVAPEQVVLSRHCTQALFVRLQRGAAASMFGNPASAHCVSLTQPGPHVWAAPPTWRQTRPFGEDAQSGLVRQVTHVLFAVSQNGCDVPAQSPLVVHTTHCCVVGSQTRLAAGQSVPPIRQPTHAPEVVSQ
jgi:hypothetical protein